MANQTNSQNKNEIPKPSSQKKLGTVLGIIILIIALGVGMYFIFISSEKQEVDTNKSVNQTAKKQNINVLNINQEVKNTNVSISNINQESSEIVTTDLDNLLNEINQLDIQIDSSFDEFESIDSAEDSEPIF